MSCAEASDLEATAEEEEELVSGSEDESGGQRHYGAVLAALSQP